MTHQLSQDQLEALVFLKDKKFDYLYMNVAASLVNLDLIETNSVDIKDGNSIASRLTQKGVDFLQTIPVQAPMPTQKAVWGAPTPSSVDNGVHFTGHNQLNPSSIAQPVHTQTEAQPVLQPVAMSEQQVSPQAAKQQPAKSTGKKKDAASKSPAVAVSTKENTTGFKINTIPLPESRRNTYFGAPKYPFKDLQVGQSFFVPISPELPDAVRTLQSAASAANTRYAKKTGETRIAKNGKEMPAYVLTRRFLVRPDIGREEDGPGMVGKKGARVGRQQ
jgi:hypothetical protein